MKHSKEPMSWEELEAALGITLERPNADNQKLKQEARHTTTTETPAAMEAASEETSASDRSWESQEEAWETREERWEENTPTVPTPAEPAKPVPPAATYGDSQATDALQKEAGVTATKPWADSSVTAVAITPTVVEPSVAPQVTTRLRRPSRLRQRLGSARNGILWAEILQPPLARRR